MVDYRAKIGGLPEDHPSPDEIRSLVQSYGVFLEDAKRWASARLLAYKKKKFHRKSFVHAVNAARQMQTGTMPLRLLREGKIQQSFCSLRGDWRVPMIRLKKGMQCWREKWLVGWSDGGGRCL